MSDDGRSAEDLRSGLPNGWVVDSCLDARTGIAALAGPPPDLVVVDLQTGSAGGFALARDMSQQARLARVPIVMLLERPQDRWLAAAAGAAETLLKPVEAEALLRSVERLTD